MKPPEPFSIQMPVGCVDRNQKGIRPSFPQAISSGPAHTLVSSVGIGAHFEDDVHERCRLRDLPVDPSRTCSCWGLGEVDDEVAHAPEEVVLVEVPLRSTAPRDVWVHV